MQNARTCPQGDLDARPCLQPHPDNHRAGCQQARYETAIDQLQGSDPDTGGIPALDSIQGERNSTHSQILYQQLLDAVATHGVADRPDRFEPRQRKRRQKKYDRMMKPRDEVKRDILKGLT